jgi:hypothetical protein
VQLPLCLLAGKTCRKIEITCNIKLVGFAKKRIPKDDVNGNGKSVSSGLLARYTCGGNNVIRYKTAYLVMSIVVVGTSKPRLSGYFLLQPVC